MSVIMDFSFKNPLIKNFFEGDNSYIPKSELMYIHSHPLINPNFLAEVEELINKTSLELQSKKMTGKVMEKFITLAQSLGRILPVLDDKNSAEALLILREIYVFCNKLLGNDNIVNKKVSR